MSDPIVAADGLSAAPERLLNHLRLLGGAARTVELSPHAMLRKEGLLATPEAVARIHGDLGTLKREGRLLVGEPTDTGIMVMLCTVGEVPILMTAKRLVALYGWMSEHEKAMLERWETKHVVIGRTSTADWPGWAVIYRRRYNPL